MKKMIGSDPASPGAGLLLVSSFVKYFCAVFKRVDYSTPTITEVALTTATAWSKAVTGVGATEAFGSQR